MENTSVATDNNSHNTIQVRNPELVNAKGRENVSTCFVLTVSNDCTVFHWPNVCLVQQPAFAKKWGAALKEQEQNKQDTSFKHKPVAPSGGRTWERWSCSPLWHMGTPYILRKCRYKLQNGLIQPCRKWDSQLTGMHKKHPKCKIKLKSSLTSITNKSVLTQTQKVLLE